MPAGFRGAKRHRPLGSPSAPPWPLASVRSRPGSPAWAIPGLPVSLLDTFHWHGVGDMDTYPHPRGLPQGALRNRGAPIVRYSMVFGGRFDGLGSPAG